MSKQFAKLFLSGLLAAITGLVVIYYPDSTVQAQGACTASINTSGIPATSAVINQDYRVIATFTGCTVNSPATLRLRDLNNTVRELGGITLNTGSNKVDAMGSFTSPGQYQFEAVVNGTVVGRSSTVVIGQAATNVPVQGNAGGCTASIDTSGIPITSANVNQDYRVIATFSGCPVNVPATIRLRDLNNALVDLGGIATGTGPNKVDAMGSFPSAGQYQIEAVVNGTVVGRSGTIVVGLTTTPGPTPNPTPPPGPIGSPEPPNPYLQNTTSYTTPAFTAPGNNVVSQSDPNAIVGVFQSPVKAGSLGELIVSVINFGLGLIGALSVLFIIIGAVRMTASHGSETAVTAGKKTVTWAVIGLAVSLLAFSIIAALQNVLGRN